jgi:hypothetical protein
MSKQEEFEALEQEFQAFKNGFTSKVNAADTELQKAMQQLQELDERLANAAYQDDKELVSSLESEISAVKATTSTIEHRLGVLSGWETREARTIKDFKVRLLDLSKEAFHEQKSCVEGLVEELARLKQKYLSRMGPLAQGLVEAARRCLAVQAFGPFRSGMRNPEFHVLEITPLEIEKQGFQFSKTPTWSAVNDNKNCRERREADENT